MLRYRSADNQETIMANGFIETPSVTEGIAERNERIRQEALAASAKKAKLAAYAPEQLAGDRDAAVDMLGQQGQAGAAAIRRAGAEQLSSVLAGAPRTGSGARLAAARSLGGQGVTKEADFGLDIAGKQSATRLAAAQGIRDAEAGAEDAKLADLSFQKDAGTSVEDNTTDVTTALGSINKKMDEYTSRFPYLRDNGGAADMIEAEALGYRDSNPALHKKLMMVADGIRKSSSALLKNGFTITAKSVGL